MRIHQEDGGAFGIQQFFHSQRDRLQNLVDQRIDGVAIAQVHGLQELLQLLGHLLDHFQELAEPLLKLAEERESAGKAAAVEVTRAKLRLAADRRRVLSAENERD